MRRRVALLAGIALVAGCTATPRSGEDQLSVDQARKAVDACHRQRVRQYDNGQSSPHDVARVVAQACEHEWMALVKLIRPVGRRTPYMVGWYHQMTLQQRRQAARTVVMIRSQTEANAVSVVPTGVGKAR